MMMDHAKTEQEKEKKAERYLGIYEGSKIKERQIFFRRKKKGKRERKKRGRKYIRGESSALCDIAGPTITGLLLNT